MNMNKVNASSHQTMLRLAETVCQKTALSVALKPVAFGLKIVSMPITLIIDFGFGIANGTTAPDHKWEHFRNKCLISPVQHLAYAVTAVAVTAFLGVGMLQIPNEILGVGAFIASGGGFAPSADQTVWKATVMVAGLSYYYYLSLSLLTVPIADKAARTVAEDFFGGTYSIFNAVQPQE
jgi:hypothetical protein